MQASAPTTNSALESASSSNASTSSSRSLNPSSTPAASEFKIVAVQEAKSTNSESLPYILKLVVQIQTEMQAGRIIENFDNLIKQLVISSNHSLTSKDSTEVFRDRIAN